MISKEDYLYFVDEALNAMAEMVTVLGDDLANRRPDLPGANSPFAVLTHCLGVMTFWGGHLVSGREVERDRDAEFTATGSVADLLGNVNIARERFGQDVAGSEPDRPLRGELPPRWDKDEGPHMRIQGAALLHVYEELAQHRGQMEGIRDCLLAGHTSG